MATNKRMYLVENKNNGAKALVKATTAAQALRVITSDAYTTKVATGSEVADLIAGGVEVFTAEDVAAAVPEKPKDHTEYSHKIPEGGVDIDQVA